MPLIEDITREFNRGMWTIGYTGQSPERLKTHMANQHTFDRTTLQANGGPADGEYYGLVITSYSIHYTKLYESCWTAPTT